MDLADRAQELQQAEIDALLSRRQPEGPPATGRCLNCDEPTAERFCDPDCRQDYTALQAKIENDRIVRGRS